MIIKRGEENREGYVDAAMELFSSTLFTGERGRKSDSSFIMENSRDTVCLIM